ncbi:MAG: four helix bundle suffix domain-containing protein [Patescibacteria group bacterium]|nr:four helix bundle suffix domain-containing protein [Patescibacteria group bacterium]
MKTQNQNLIPPHGGYRKLKSFQAATIVFDLTVEFCNRFIENRTSRAYGTNRTWDQMTQAARSGKQNIAEASQASGTSKKTELKLLNVARASQEELLLDFEDFLRLRKLPIWEKHDPRALVWRRRWPNWSDQSDRSDLTNPTIFANAMICLIHQTNFLLDRQLKALEKQFLEEGGFTEKLFWCRRNFRSDQSVRSDQSKS